MKRKHLSRGKSRRAFQNNAAAHPKNSSPKPMRGGIRL